MKLIQREGFNLAHLQEADGHEEKTVGADSTSENLIEVPLQEELLQHQDQVRQHRVFLQSRRHSGDIVKTCYCLHNKS